MSIKAKILCWMISASKRVSGQHNENSEACRTEATESIQYRKVVQEDHIAIIRESNWGFDEYYGVRK
jgi:hypothetical protein